MNNFFNQLLTRISIKEKTLFAKRLSFLIRAGVPIAQSLMILRSQTKSGARLRVMDQVLKDVNNGHYLSASLAKFQHNFDPLAINLIRVGEESGTLDENLNYLAEEMKKKQELRRKVLGAMVYPIFIILATLGISGLLTIYIFPKILPIFASLDVNLPITTRALIWTSDFLKNYGLYLALGLAGLIILNLFLVRTSNNFRLVAHKIVLKIPLIGSISKNYHLANICRTLGILIKSDIRIIRAFTITSETITNLVYKRELETISKKLVRGDKIALNMSQRAHLFPSMLTHLVEIGEATGKLDETFVYLSEMYEAEVDELTKNLSTILEPALMVFMGIVVGFIAVSIITPIYEITRNLTP
ncbi:MAG: type II secretion system F family protein [Patescibacteria group bacterium]